MRAPNKAPLAAALAASGGGGGSGGAIHPVHTSHVTATGTGRPTSPFGHFLDGIWDFLGRLFGRPPEAAARVAVGRQNPGWVSRRAVSARVWRVRGTG